MMRPFRSLFLGLLLLQAVPMAALAAGSAPAKHDTYSEDEVAKAASQFFATGAKELSACWSACSRKTASPSRSSAARKRAARSASASAMARARLSTKGAGVRKIYWQGPSIGFDLGANAVKVFALVYDLPKLDDLFRRYPGVDGSLYFVGGFGVNYVQRDQTVIAPVRFGVGWRQGINLGYMNFSREKRLNPL